VVSCGLLQSRRRQPAIVRGLLRFSGVHTILSHTLINVATTTSIGLCRPSWFSTLQLRWSTSTRKQGNCRHQMCLAPVLPLVGQFEYSSRCQIILLPMLSHFEYNNVYENLAKIKRLRRCSQTLHTHIGLQYTYSRFMSGGDTA